MCEWMYGRVSGWVHLVGVCEVCVSGHIVPVCI